MKAKSVIHIRMLIRDGVPVYLGNIPPSPPHTTAFPLPIFATHVHVFNMVGWISISLHSVLPFSYQVNLPWCWQRKGGNNCETETRKFKKIMLRKKSWSNNRHVERRREQKQKTYCLSFCLRTRKLWKKNCNRAMLKCENISRRVCIR